MEGEKAAIDHIDNLAVSTETHHNNLSVLRSLDTANRRSAGGLKVRAVAGTLACAGTSD